jgi:plasmid stability protein
MHTISSKQKDVEVSSMSTLVIHNCPSQVHDRLKELARQSKRSISGIAAGILQRAVCQEQPLPEPVAGRFAITQEWLSQAVKEGRE